MPKLYTLFQLQELSGLDVEELLATVLRLHKENAVTLHVDVSRLEISHLFHTLSQESDPHCRKGKSQ